MVPKRCSPRCQYHQGHCGRFNFLRKKHRIVQTCLDAAQTASPRGSSQFQREITPHFFQRVVSLRSWVSTVVIKKQAQYENPHR